MMIENGKTSAKEKIYWKGRLHSWRSALFDIMKYPVAIVLFNFSIFLYIKLRMNDGNLELILRESTPRLY